MDIIIPTYNEENALPRLLERLFEAGIAASDILIVDGGSQDRTLQVAAAHQIKFIQSEQRGRAYQMNVGARATSQKMLYFIHADTLPPKTFVQDIQAAITDGFRSGCFRLTFDSRSPLLKVNAFFTRFNKLWCRGGDQTLFVERDLFEELGGFNEKQQIMEEYDFIEKLQEKSTFKILPKNAIVSSRKYEKNSYWRVQFANFVVFKMYKKGMDQDKMVKTYQNLLKLR